MSDMSGLAALTTGADLKTWVLQIAGNILIVAFVVRSLGAFLKNERGEFLSLFAAAVLVAGWIWFPDASVALLKAIWQKAISS